MITPNYTPLSHQKTFLERDARRNSWGLLWEQGCGKTFALINNAALLNDEGAVDGMFVIAPNGVHQNWRLEELPKHWPKDARPYLCFAWDTTKAVNKSYQRDWAHFLAETDPGNPQHCFGVLCLSYDGAITPAGKAAHWAFTKRYAGRVMGVADESQRIKTPQLRGKNATERTVVLTKMSQYADYRRIASGTPMDTPLDIYSQVRWVDFDFWAREMGVGSFSAFRAYFSILKKVYLNDGRSFEEVVGYKNLDVLRQALTKISHRVEKSDALDLPPKTYSRIVHQMTPAQKRAYTDIRRDAMTTLDDYTDVTITHALTVQMRLAQVSAGFIVPATGEQPYIFADNPRTYDLTQHLKDHPAPAIIWHQWTPDRDQISEACSKAGRRAAVYSAEDAATVLPAFRRGDLDVIIASLSSGMTEGVTLTEAKQVIYYTCGPRVITRLQSEDRAHRIGQTGTVSYYDMVAEGTADARNLKRLMTKRDWSAEALGDNRELARDWLRETLEEEPA